MIAKLCTHPENRSQAQSRLASDDGRQETLECVSPEEREALLYAYNRTSVDYGPAQTIHELFEDQVRRTPGNVAVRFNDERLTFERLNTRANKLAHYLKRRGAEPGMRIGICVDRSVDMMVGLLGIIKTGAAYVPLDPHLPMLRLKEIVGDCNPAILLLHRHRDGFDDFGDLKVFIDADWHRIACESAENPSAQASTRRVLNLIYTSATTGRPKGVVISESAVLNRLHWMWDAYPFEHGDVALIQKSPALVASGWELFGGLLRGVPSVILSQDELLDPARLWQVCARHGVTHFLATPALIEGVLLQAARSPVEWRTLRFATTSAEPIPTTMVRRWREVFPHVPLLNLYGATECASNATVFDTRELGDDDLRVPLGRPIANVRTYVLDEHLNLLPHGATGELCVSGACLAEGYLGLPALTEERFVENPFSEESGDRLYRTGDLVRMRSDGNLEFVGRRDNQVNIRGFRVELEEVEAVLNAHPAVKRAVAVLADGPDGRGALTAYILPAGDAQTLHPPDFRNFMEARLPGYMVPSHFAVVGRIPLTRAGKIDRRLLGGQCSDASTTRCSSAPRTEIEIRLAQIWEELLKIDRIGCEDDFFDLGGHSLLAVRLFAEINCVFGKDLPLSTLYRSRTLGALAQIIADADAARDWPDLVPMTTRPDLSLPAFLCVHGILGDVLFYKCLADGLGPSRPLYALQPPTLAGRPVACASVQDLAARYVEAIRAVQPSGPYYLGGYSYGARVALEMAQILRAQGEAPALLVSFDGYAGGRVSLRILHEENIGVIGLSEARGPLSRVARTLRSCYPAWRFYMYCKGLRAKSVWLTLWAYAAFGRALPRRLRATYTEEKLHHIARRYHPEPYDGRTIVFCTAQRRRTLMEDWRSVVGAHAHFVDIDGRHDGVFEGQNLKLITARLNEELRGRGGAGTSQRDC